MKFTKKIATTAFTGVLVIGMASAAFATGAGPHLLYGTERTYGEDKTQHKELR